MTARDKQQQIRKCQPICEPGSQRVPLKVINSEIGQPSCRCYRLCAHRANKDAANKPRAAGGCYAINIIKAAACF